MRNHIVFFMLFGLVSLTLVGCQESEAGDPSTAAVQSYYKALVEKDRDAFANLSCADWEETALTEFDSFGGVTPELQDIDCQQTSLDGDTAQVTCTGKIVASYGNEQMEFPLEERLHTVKKENGDWRVCGY